MKIKKTARRFIVLTLCLGMVLQAFGLLPKETKVSAASVLEEKTIQVGNENVSYSVGKKENKKGTLIFIHGALVTKESMTSLATSITKDYQVVTVDISGHGGSDVSPATSIAQYADTVEGFITALLSKNEISSNITLVGWSMGGAVALDLSSRNIPEINNLVLISSGYKFAIPPLPEEYMSLGFLAPMTFTSLTTQEDKEDILSVVSNASASHEASVSDFNVAAACDGYELLSKIDIPTLILAGDQDPLAPLSIQESMNKEITNSEMKIYEGRSHCLILEVPELLAKDIKEFLK